MAIKKQNLNMYQRSDYLIEITITDEDGLPVDITGAVFEWKLRNLSGDDALVKTSDDGEIVIIDAANGVINIQISEEDLDIATGMHTHECRLRDIFGNTAPTTVGTVQILKSITNV